MIFPFSSRYTSQNWTSILRPVGASRPAGELNGPRWVPRPMPCATTVSPRATRLRTSQVASGKISNQLFHGLMIADSPVAAWPPRPSPASVFPPARSWMKSPFAVTHDLKLRFEPDWRPSTKARLKREHRGATRPHVQDS